VSLPPALDICPSTARSQASESVSDVEIMTRVHGREAEGEGHGPYLSPPRAAEGHDLATSWLLQAHASRSPLMSDKLGGWTRQDLKR
jgi:hypothetical protein